MLQKKYKPSWLLKSINLALLTTNIILFLLIISFGVFSPSFFIAFFVLEVLFYLYMGLDFYFQKKNLEAKNKEGSQTQESNTYSYNIFEKCFGIGKSSLQNDKEEQSRRNTAIKDFRMLMTRVSDDLETIEIKLLEDIEILERIHQAYCGDKESTRSDTSEEQESEAKTYSPFKELIDNYKLLLNSYPEAFDFESMSASDLEVFISHYEEHHHLLVEVAAQLLSVMDFQTREILAKYDHLEQLKTSTQKFSATSKP